MSEYVRLPELSEIEFGTKVYFNGYDRDMNMTQVLGYIVDCKPSYNYIGIVTETPIYSEAREKRGYVIDVDGTKMYLSYLSPNYLSRKDDEISLSKEFEGVKERYNKSTFTCGNIVTLKQYDELIKIFGKNEFGNLNVPIAFSGAKNYCGMSGMITMSSNDRVGVYIKNKEIIAIPQMFEEYSNDESMLLNNKFELSVLKLISLLVKNIPNVLPNINKDLEPSLKALYISGKEQKMGDFDIKALEYDEKTNSYLCAIINRGHRRSEYLNYDTDVNLPYKTAMSYSNSKVSKVIKKGFNSFREAYDLKLSDFIKRTHSQTDIIGRKISIVTEYASLPSLLDVEKYYKQISNWNYEYYVCWTDAISAMYSLKSSVRNEEPIWGNRQSYTNFVFDTYGHIYNVRYTEVSTVVMIVKIKEDVFGNLNPVIKVGNI